MAFRLQALQGFHAYGLAFILGCFFPLGFAPFNAFPVTILSMMGLAWLWQGRSLKHTLLSGWWYGFGLYSAGVSWVYVSIHQFGDTPALLAIIMTAAFTAGLAIFTTFQAWLYHSLKLQRFYLLGFPALWVFSEWLRTWVLTGFPWLFSGYAFIDTPLSGYAPVFGVMGISFVASFIACSLLAMSKLLGLNAEESSGKNPKQFYHFALYSSLIVVLTLTGWGLQRIEWTTLSQKEPLSVSLVQGNVPQSSKWSAEMREYTLNLYPELSASSWGKDLIIWPEAAIPAFRYEVLDYLEQLNKIAVAQGTTLITGIPIVENPGNNPNQSDKAYFNAIIAIGNGSGSYHKQKLVPFGEYVPLENWLRGLMPFFNLPMSGFNRGESHQPPLMAGNVRIAPFVCYEIVYPDLVAAGGSQADVLLTLSNDAWFGESIAPLQHFEMARMRALELGKYLLRGTNNGMTGIIDHKGKVLELAPQFSTWVLNGEVKLTDGATPFSRYGSKPVLFLAVLIIAVCLGFSRKLT